jgi:hypothetical protein
MLPGKPHTVPAVEINIPLCNADTSICNQTRRAVEVPMSDGINYHKKQKSWTSCAWLYKLYHFYDKW